MADYIYLLENRLSGAQKAALTAVREVARSKGVTLFLVGGAVRDLTSGSPVRDLDVVVQGNALKLKKEMELAGAVIYGSWDAGQALYVRFPGGVRMEVGSTLSVTYPKPGKPVMKASTILDDLRRRDFTANAMALSLNDGSYGLLMDPLNGIADIENRELRLVSNYGFIEDPVRMVRAARFAARLGWELEEKTKTRYETGKQEGYISALDDFKRGYEAEEIVHEEDPLRVMRRLEAEGWLEKLAAGWTTAKVNAAEMEKVREAQTQLQMQGIHPDASAINFPLLTAKLGAKEVQALKKSFPRQGFVAEIEAAEGEGKELAAALGGRGASLPSAAYRMIASAKPEALLYLAYTTKSPTLQGKLKSFMTEWPQARQKVPYALMQEMRITPELDGYKELVESIFFELMDGKLGSTEEMKAFLEPHSPPAPPPPVHVRRARSTKKDAKGKGKGKKDAVAEDEDDADVTDLDAEDGDAAPRGAEEDEEAEDAAEDFDAVAELGGATSARKEREEEDEDEEEEEVASSAGRRVPPVKKAVDKAVEAVPAPQVASVPPVEGASAENVENASKKTVKPAEGSAKVAAPIPVEAAKVAKGKQIPGAGDGGDRTKVADAKAPGKAVAIPAQPAKSTGKASGAVTPTKSAAKQVVVAVPAKAVPKKAIPVKAIPAKTAPGAAVAVKAVAAKAASAASKGVKKVSGSKS